MDATQPQDPSLLFPVSIITAIDQSQTRERCVCINLLGTVDKLSGATVHSHTLAPIDLRVSGEQKRTGANLSLSAAKTYNKVFIS